MLAFIFGTKKTTRFANPYFYKMIIMFASMNIKRKNLIPHYAMNWSLYR
jgi:ribosomal protein L30E